MKIKRILICLQSELSSLQERLCGGGWEVQKARLTARLEQREQELAKAKEQCDVLQHQMELTKKEVRYSCDGLIYARRNPHSR